uniref:Uncharacterized protein n=1 Tax=Sinocyclocheilus rhinocerous TaxID=307959 RepID=A0A673FZU8_9TELE
MPPPSDIVKVAIEWPGANAQLIEFDQKKPLASIIREVYELTRSLYNNSSVISLIVHCQPPSSVTSLSD